MIAGTDPHLALPVGPWHFFVREPDSLCGQVDGDMRTTPAVIGLPGDSGLCGRCVAELQPRGVGRGVHFCTWCSRELPGMLDRKAAAMIAGDEALAGLQRLVKAGLANRFCDLACHAYAFAADLSWRDLQLTPPPEEPRPGTVGV